MIELTQQHLWIFHGVVIVLLIACIYEGKKYGFGRTLLSLIGVAAAFFASWRFSIVIARHITVFSIPAFAEDPLGITSVYRQYINQICWFVILFIVIRIALWLADRMLRTVDEIPVIKQASQMAGACLGFLKAVIWIFVLCVFLNTPLFANGNAFIKGSYLNTVLNLPIVQDTVLPMINRENFEHLLEGAEELTSKQEENLENWLVENGFDGITLR